MSAGVLMLTAKRIIRKNKSRVEQRWFTLDVYLYSIFLFQFYEDIYEDVFLHDMTLYCEDQAEELRRNCTCSEYMKSVKV